MIRVIIADDHPLIRDGFKKLLTTEDDISLVGEAENGAEVLSLINETSPDVLVLDIGLPDKNGMDILEEIQTLDLHIGILVLSMYPERRFAKRAFTSGAAGYLTKDTAPEELVGAIRKIYSSGHYMTGPLAELIAEDYQKKIEGEPHENLSRREYQILISIAEGKTIKEIAFELSLSINTVNSYRKRLLQKMDLDTNAQLIKYALRHNLID